MPFPATWIDPEGTGLKERPDDKDKYHMTSQ